MRSHRAPQTQRHRPRRRVEKLAQVEACSGTARVDNGDSQSRRHQGPNGFKDTTKSANSEKQGRDTTPDRRGSGCEIFETTRVSPSDETASLDERPVSNGHL